ncbi:MAG: lactate racemase domain-containing protein [Bryobacteraceae bacterium]
MFLSADEVRAQVARGLRQLPVELLRVLVVIPDGTRTMPMPLMYELLVQELGPRVAALDFLVALGTHTPMSDEQLSRHLGVPVVNGQAGERKIFNHKWDDPATFVELGRIPAAEIEELTDGMMTQEVPVSLNRLILDYDHLLICGPVFPHEVAGFSGGAKYFFPGIAGPEIIHFTHWLGALLTSFDIIGTKETPVRRVIHRATEFIRKPHSLLAPVLTPEGIAGIFCGRTVKAWRAAAELSAQCHIVWLEKPVQRVLAILPEMYGDLWTGGKGMYKLEPAIADGGEVVLYAPHITEVSKVHGKLIEEIGYHCRDYFVKQWDKFGSLPGGILAHSTHVKGKGTFEDGVETPRIRVTLATGIPEEQCRKINLGYMDPATVDHAAFDLVVPRAGEMLYRLKAAAMF